MKNLKSTLIIILISRGIVFTSDTLVKINDKYWGAVIQNYISYNFPDEFSNYI